MGDSLAIPTNATVAEIVITDANGRRRRIPVLAGRDTSEVAYDRADVRALVRHGRAKIFSREPGANHYRAEFSLAMHAPVVRVDVRWLYPDTSHGGITIEKLSLVNDARKSAYAFSWLAPFYAQPHRWRPLPLDSSIAAFENLDAQLLLQLTYLAADARLRSEQDIGDFSQVITTACRFADGAQLLKIHPISSCRSCMLYY